MDLKTRATLLERLRDGADQLSWEEFFRDYWPVVFALARRRGCSDQTAEEVVQDVMLKVFQQRDFYQYDPARGRFRNWLGTLVRNCVAECRRRPSERVRARGGDSSGDRIDPIDDGAEPDAQCEAAFEEALLLVLLDVVRREVDPRTFLAFELAGPGRTLGPPSLQDHRPQSQRGLQGAAEGDAAAGRTGRRLSAQRPASRSTQAGPGESS